MTGQVAQGGIAVDDDDAEDGREIIRAKWIMDGAATLAEAAAKVRAFAEFLDQRHAEGWTLTQPVEDDYGSLEPPASS